MHNGSGSNVEDTNHHASSEFATPSRRCAENARANRARDNMLSTGGESFRDLDMTVCSRTAVKEKGAVAERQVGRVQNVRRVVKEKRSDDISEAHGTGSAGRELGHLPPIPPRTTDLLAEGIERGVYLRGGAPAPKPGQPHAAADLVTTRFSQNVASLKPGLGLAVFRNHIPRPGLDLATDVNMVATCHVVRASAPPPIPPLTTAARKGGITSGAHLQESAQP